MANYEFECELDGIFTIEFPIGTAPDTAQLSFAHRRPDRFAFSGPVSFRY